MARTDSFDRLKCMCVHCLVWISLKERKEVDRKDLSNKYKRRGGLVASGRNKMLHIVQLLNRA
jgi:hypothetical protein